MKKKTLRKCKKNNFQRLRRRPFPPKSQIGERRVRKIWEGLEGGGGEGGSGIRTGRPPWLLHRFNTRTSDESCGHLSRPLQVVGVQLCPCAFCAFRALRHLPVGSNDSSGGRGGLDIRRFQRPDSTAKVPVANPWQRRATLPPPGLKPNVPKTAQKPTHRSWVSTRGVTWQHW